MKIKLHIVKTLRYSDSSDTVIHITQYIYAILNSDLILISDRALVMLCIVMISCMGSIYFSKRDSITSYRENVEK